MRGKQYYYPYEAKRENPREIVSWLRRNFGQRGTGWDFQLSSGYVIIQVWDDKLQVIYELWHC